MSFMPAETLKAQYPRAETRAHTKNQTADGAAHTAARAALHAAPRHSRLGKTLLLVAALAVLIGLRLKPYQYLVAESGTGYVLGILGSSCMVLLLLYPLRKNLRALRNFGSVRFWFNVHLALGIAGPVAVLYHSNFSLGSLHSTFVLAATVLVTLSGFTGLFIHTRIHCGLFDSCAQLTTLRKAPVQKTEGFRRLLDYAPKLAVRLERLEQYSIRKPSGPMHGLLRVVALGIWARWTRLVMLAGLSRAIRVIAAREKWSGAQRSKMHLEIKKNLKAYSKTILKVAELGFYERLLSIWHFFHYPLYLMLIILGTVHVVIVQMY